MARPSCEEASSKAKVAFIAPREDSRARSNLGSLGSGAIAVKSAEREFEAVFTNNVHTQSAIFTRSGEGYFEANPPELIMSLWPLQAFDPKAGFGVLERKLPHWSQAGTICFITWRTLDSMPKSVLNRWHADREDWLRRHGINPKADDWKSQLRELTPDLQGEFVRSFSERWHRSLDACHGECVLKRPELFRIVSDCLLKFDGDRYELTDFVVMPNHVHLLAAFVNEEGMLAQCEGWKHYQAVQLHRQLGSSGRFWQQDGFDHLVRSVEQFEALRHYIARNPERANLKPGEFRHYSKDLLPPAGGSSSK